MKTANSTRAVHAMLETGVSKSDAFLAALLSGMSARRAAASVASWPAPALRKRYAGANSLAVFLILLDAAVALSCSSVWLSRMVPEAALFTVALCVAAALAFAGAVHSFRCAGYRTYLAVTLLLLPFQFGIAAADPLSAVPPLLSTMLAASAVWLVHRLVFPDYHAFLILRHDGAGGYRFVDRARGAAGQR